MRVSSRIRRRLTIALGVAGLTTALVAVVVRKWVVPALIVARIGEIHPGKVTIGGWWINGRSAGVRDLVLHETKSAASPVWARARSVSTDLTWRGLLSGETTPRRVTVRSPSVTLRFDEQGRLLTQPAFGGRATGPSAIPVVVVEDARLTLTRSDGKRPMVVSGIKAIVDPSKSPLTISARTDDPAWTEWTLAGEADASFGRGSFVLSGREVADASEKIKHAPFVPPEVGDHIQPQGPIDVDAELRWSPSSPLLARTTIRFSKTTVSLPSLGLSSQETTGSMVVEGAVVRIPAMRGRALGGRIDTTGTLDFQHAPPLIDLKLNLSGINVADAPSSWRMRETGITGRLTGSAHLRAALTANGPDFSGTTGEAVIDGAALQGIPINSPRLSMTAQGDALRYESPDVGSLLASGLRNSRKGGASIETRVDPPLPGRTGFNLPKTLSTNIELNDVELSKILARGEAVGIHLPFALAGTLSLKAEATIPLGALRELKAYRFRGVLTLKSAHIDGVDFGRLAARLDLKDGVLELRDFRGQLVERPNGGIRNRPPSTPEVPAAGPLPPGGFRGHLRVAVAPPGQLSARFEGDRLPMAELLALVLPRPTPATGWLTLRAEAKGSLAPMRLWSEGEGRVDALGVGVFPVGNVPVRWVTKADAIVIEGIEAQSFGGRVSLTAEFPTTGDRPAHGRAEISDLDLSKLSAVLPEGNLKLGGKANGTLVFQAPRDASSPEAKLALAAPELTVQGIPADGLEASVTVHRGVAAYNLSARSLGGQVRFRGDYPFAASSKADEANARLQFAGFQLSGLWRAWKPRGAWAQLEGLAAIDANLRMNRQGTDLRAHGIAEARDLRWGNGTPLGGLRGEVVITPEEWRVRALTGELFGGPVNGEIWVDTSRPPANPVGFEARIEHASLARIAAFQPKIASYVKGFVNLRMSGRFDESSRMEGEAFAAEARLFSLPVAELRIPAEVSYNPAAGRGVARIRRFSARTGGGKIRGDARFQFGGGESFDVDAEVSALDIETLTRLLTDVRRPSGGKLSGKIHLSGTDPDDLKALRGKIDLDLDDAALVELPVFREIDRLFGAARGGIFEDGDLHGVIADRRLAIEELALSGRLAQIHASGTVGFDGKVDLVAVVNTNQIISQTGQNLVALIPGLRNLEGRPAEATRAFSGFLSNRLLKIRVTGTLSEPRVNVDPGVVISAAAVGFFNSVLQLPAGLLR